MITASLKHPRKNRPDVPQVGIQGKSLIVWSAISVPKCLIGGDERLQIAACPRLSWRYRCTHS